MSQETNVSPDAGPPEERSRRTFLANATVAIGGVIGVVLAVPLLGSVVPESVVKGDRGRGTWADLPPAEFLKLKAASTDPVKLNFSCQYADGYFPPNDDEQFVWGIALTPEMEATFKAARSDRFASGTSAVPYPVVNWIRDL